MIDSFQKLKNPQEREAFLKLALDPGTISRFVKLLPALPTEPSLPKLLAVAELPPGELHQIINNPNPVSIEELFSSLVANRRAGVICRVVENALFAWDIKVEFEDGKVKNWTRPHPSRLERILPSPDEAAKVFDMFMSILFAGADLVDRKLVPIIWLQHVAIRNLYALSASNETPWDGFRRDEILKDVEATTYGLENAFAGIDFYGLMETNPATRRFYLTPRGAAAAEGSFEEFNRLGADRARLLERMAKDWVPGTRYFRNHVEGFPGRLVPPRHVDFHIWQLHMERLVEIESGGSRNNYYSCAWPTKAALERVGSVQPTQPRKAPAPLAATIFDPSFCQTLADLIDGLVDLEVKSLRNSITDNEGFRRLLRKADFSESLIDRHCKGHKAGLAGYLGGLAEARDFGALRQMAQVFLRAMAFPSLDDAEKHLREGLGMNPAAEGYLQAVLICKGLLFAFQYDGDELQERALIAGRTELIGDGYYKPVESLARGGNGIVWKATRPNLKGEWAIKLYEPRPPHRHKKNELRFRREYQFLKEYPHRNIISVADFGEVRGRLVYTMPFMPSNLRTVVQRPTIGPDGMVRIIEQIFEGVAYLHGLSPAVVHRDLKPENILILSESNEIVAKLADFGIAHIEVERVAEECKGVTRLPAPETEKLCNLYYAAPEQFATDPEEWTSAVDVYAAGLIACELLTEIKPPGFPARPVLNAVKDKRVVEIISALEGALNPDPGLRPNARKLLEKIRSFTR